MQNQETLKEKVAQAVLAYIKPNRVLGLGSGTTVNCLITHLATLKSKIEGVVAASIETEKRLKQQGLPVLDLNNIGEEISLYIDSTDEVNSHLQLIKGGGGALTREKIIAAASRCFICIADESKLVTVLGKTRRLPVEVVQMGRSYIARELVKLGGFPVYREGVITDNGNVILDVANLDFHNPIQLEHSLNNIPGVVCNGLFAQRPADKLLLATSHEVKVIER